jgi:hypothetical protein
LQGYRWLRQAGWAIPPRVSAGVPGYVETIYKRGTTTSANEGEITMIGNKPFITLSLAALSVLGAASVAWAGSKDDADSRGGYVNPPSMDGVNPAYHPDWFPGYPGVHRAPDANPYAFPGASNPYTAYYPTASNAYNAYGFVPRASHKHRWSR